jgi:hypothetical protein
MNILEHQWFHESIRSVPLACVFPCSDMAKILVVAQSFALLRLKLFAEMSATGFAALQCVQAQELAQFQEICNSARFFE